jgi:hypothetical protein
MLSKYLDLELIYGHLWVAQFDLAPLKQRMVVRSQEKIYWGYNTAIYMIFIVVVDQNLI